MGASAEKRRSIENPGGIVRTRVKICGITRPADARAAAEAGADAIGLVFYPPSPRFLSVERALEIRDALPPFVQTVALFVNPDAAQVAQVIGRVRPAMLQFHGEETPRFCGEFGLPYIKACRVKGGVSTELDLLEDLRPFSRATAWLLDSHVEEYGGVGERFDWSLVPAVRERPLVLSGGLAPGNVAEAIRRVRPWGVDVSSGVESAKGIKDAAKIAAFVAEVRNANV
jgi:phosphoribosylanthranilate isomerase